MCTITYTLCLHVCLHTVSIMLHVRYTHFFCILKDHTILNVACTVSSCHALTRTLTLAHLFVLKTRSRRAVKLVLIPMRQSRWHTVHHQHREETNNSNNTKIIERRHILEISEVNKSGFLANRRSPQQTTHTSCERPRKRRRKSVGSSVTLFPRCLSPFFILLY